MKPTYRRSEHRFFTVAEGLNHAEPDLSQCDGCGLWSIALRREGHNLVAYAADAEEPRRWVVPEEEPPCRRWRQR